MRTPLDSEKNRTLLTKLSKEDAGRWRKLGDKIFAASTHSYDLAGAYVDAGAELLSLDSFEYLESWVSLGLEIDRLSGETAVAFFRATPEFLKTGKMVHLRQWAAGAFQILDIGKGMERAAAAYLYGSSRMHRYMAVMLYKEWKQTGLLFAKKSAELAVCFFNMQPEGIALLYRSEIKGILRLVSTIARKSPEKGLAFYEQSPGRLVVLNPNIRDKVIKTTARISSNNPDLILETYREITAAVTSLSYPIQEKTMVLEEAIGDLSEDASLAYFKNLKPLLCEIPEKFLDNWVREGVRLLMDQPGEGIGYFSLENRSSRQALVKWKEVVVLDDIRKSLSIFARALAGDEIKIKSTEDITFSKDVVEKRQKRTYDTVYLPPYIAEEDSREANFRLYKVATAHHTGCVEFGTFGPAYPVIRKMLRSFPYPDLALEIFFMVEDGRIDHRLKQEYKGLAKDMDLALAGIMTRRDFPKDNLVAEALEILLRFNAGCLQKADIPPEAMVVYFFIEEILTRFYHKTRKVWDSFRVSVDIYNMLISFVEDTATRSVAPLPYWDRPDFEDLHGSSPVVTLPDEIKAAEDDMGGAKILFSKEELEELLKNLKEPLKLKQVKDQGISDGMFLTDLEGFALEDQVPEEEAVEYRKAGLESPLPAARTSVNGPYYYDEWDHLQGTYRRRWCRLTEELVVPVESDRFREIHDAYNNLIQKVKKKFQEIRPQIFEVLHRVDWGDEIDLPEMIQSVVDKKTGDDPTDRIFCRKEKRIRRISTLILLDMSASTGEEINAFYAAAGREDIPGNATGVDQKDKTIIDIEIESLVVLAEALNALNDEYAIYGFSGQGKDKVEFYTVKDFTDPYSEETKNRICGIMPKQSTRMGTAIRHATQKLRTVETDLRLMILLSDGYPQDTDYGEDRGSNDYALNDTMMALSEARKEGIRLFCLTVDQAGNDYLRKMCDPSSYLIIRDINSLPEILPRVVESLMG